MNKLFLSLATYLCLGLLPLPAQEKAINKIIETGQTDNRTMQHLDILTNRFGGRLVGSNAFENAQEWMVREMKSWGLDVKLEEAGSVPVGFNRGPWFGRMLNDNGMTLHFITPSFTSGTKGLQRGHVLPEPKTQDEFKRMKAAMKGAWILISGQSDGFPIDRTKQADSIRTAIKAENDETAKENRDRMRRNWSGEKNEMLPYREFPALFYKEMCEAGVLGFIQSSPVPLRGLYDRKMIDNGEMNFDNLPDKPDIKLDEHQFKVIKQMVDERREFLLEFDIRNHFRIGPVKFHNVVASIKGSQYPDEYVIVSGHLDAFDVATGGVDCATGIAPMMEAARMIALSGAKPKRTILFVAFAAEEFGLLGAKAFAKTHAKILPKIANLFNRDGGPLPPVGITVPPAMYDDFVKVCEPIKRIRPDYPFEVKKQEKPNPRPKAPSSHDGSVFAVKGVPIFNFMTDDFKGYNFNYGEIWHTERDLYTKNVPEYQEHTATCIAITALGIANLNHQLSREGAYQE
ncbi:carboxypeptidase Q [Parabacteroides sp. PF5-5]|uniref:M20/M25/M40 family metallo-hydrolase n=1 Tax=unclassified Parabacteroides TaxID=2649774 RepID=UPI00247721D8|nr:MULTISPECIES: M20/M25/M40 family metallo-hydrolase [unclassified Parabacteroides]MDH6303617.1 carboxypeptidase Q [Parabacteroides sp. PH5-39]MDH6314939.1 carboxypeptidase Q [Parabacteroides sp. PF5-13]MDH6318276.1 carboxypeptidase Q [Parabacteroides sp. PH5-13]MDH6321791.1 carboxypeptidase Q [Parabacteroides sp. PH5-8]MDH6325915.1 carboxypeptidase Q [Parabacteroides sp. PH5-41]